MGRELVIIQTPDDSLCVVEIHDAIVLGRTRECLVLRVVVLVGSNVMVGHIESELAAVDHHILENVRMLTARWDTFAREMLHLVQGASAVRVHTNQASQVRAHPVCRE